MLKKVVIGMSGGVDSSVAAYLLREKGYEVIGVTMKTLKDDDVRVSTIGHEDAMKVAKTLGINHYFVDFHEDFKEQVMDNFVEEYLAGRTPNPCIVCNRYVKFEALLSFARKMGAEYIATGHYARIDQLENGRMAIRNSVTAKKDQTYALYRLTQEQLQHTLMPIGEFEKEEIREIAKKIGIDVANKPDSQEICFIPDDNYVEFIHDYTEGKVCPKGNFVDKDGNILGQHKGIMHYTIGQRKGLNLALGHPVFVTKICAQSNEVVIGEAEDVFTQEIRCKDLNYMGMADFNDGKRVLAKIRYSDKGAYCTLHKVDDGIVQCLFEQPVRASTPGQGIVFYEGEYILGGGTII